MNFLRSAYTRYTRYTRYIRGIIFDYVALVNAWSNKVDLYAARPSRVSDAGDSYRRHTYRYAIWVADYFRHYTLVGCPVKRTCYIHSEFVRRTSRVGLAKPLYPTVL